jgi:two-component system phosphate regulon response regulator PhoB
MSVDPAPATTGAVPGLLARLDSFIKIPAPSAGDPAGATVLVVLNEPGLATLLGYCLSGAGFAVTLAENASDGVLRARRLAPHVVLLDARPSGRESAAVWRDLRESADDEPPPAIIMFIRDEADIDPGLGLEFGPCDFVVYPFDVRDLVLRIDGIIRARRGGSAAALKPSRRRYLIGPLELDVHRHTAVVLGMPTHISSLEMRLLIYLIENRGSVRSREELLADVWGYRAGVATRTADTHINRLRNKLGTAARLIETVRGAGYRLSPEYPVAWTD